MNENVFRDNEGGSVSFDDVKVVLKGQPTIEQLIENSLKVSFDGTGIRLGRHWTYLGGRRIGPYYFDVSDKGIVDRVFTMTLIIQTKSVFLDENAMPLKEDDPNLLENAHDVSEKLTHIELKEIK